MMKVFIVEDNRLIRQALTESIDWPLLGCEIVGEAADGAAALKHIVASAPDIVITDIKMPEMDGLALAEKLRIYNNHAKAIIITGYDEFSYAQRALKLGAFDLILKPIDNSELQHVVMRAVSEIAQERKQINEQSQLREQHYQMERVQLLSELVQGAAIPAQTLERRGRDLGLTFHKHSLLLIQPYPTDVDRSIPTGEADRMLLGLVQEALHSPTATADSITFWMHGTIVVLTVYDTREPDYAIAASARAHARRLLEQLSAVAECTPVIAIGDVRAGIATVRQSYQEAARFLERRFFADDMNVVHAGSFSTRRIAYEYAIMKKINRIYQYIQYGKTGIDQLLDDIFQDIKNQENERAAYVRGLLVEMCMTTQKIMFEQLDAPFHLYKTLPELQADVYAADHIDSAFQYVRAFILKLYDAMHTCAAATASGYSPATQRVFEYLNANYHRKVSLQEAADLVGVSPSHLSRMLKRDTGETFVDMFNRIKIGVAIQLLRYPSLKAYEVDERVGIDNYAYFYQLFKKSTGQSPMDYHAKRHSCIEQNTR